MRPNNKFESQGESILDSCKTSNDVRCRYVGSEESTREEVGCGGHRRAGRGVRGSGGQLTPQFGQIYDIYSGKIQHICLTNCVTPNGTSIHLPEIHFGWGRPNKGDVHRV